ncbi:MAG: hypothetical protein SAJ12_13395 [Jaaginema sp. PMC 1079.18]|nr:hypothetical protein [Jaaginema sp. PMC 1080.18]MEC4851977.1 hypothetical protein [Jaaginema sp. PMC 1079.18]MEC4868383.1 hypothetical protein [Jaaginema sp. PMC 1078.18]
MKFLQHSYLSALVAAGIIFAPIAIAPVSQAQQVVNISPTNNQAVSQDSSISGVFDTSTGTVNASTVQLFVNNQNVTNRSTITPTFFSYKSPQPLPAGQNTVRVEYISTGGQKQAVSWTFQVQQPQAALAIESVTHNATNAALGSGSTFLATITGTPNAQATVIVLDGNTMRRLPTQEISRGVYVATLNLSNSDRITEGVVLGRLERQGNVVYGAAEQPVAFQPGATQVTPVTENGTPQTPTPTQPTNFANLQPKFNYSDGGIINSQGFTLNGTTEPNAQIRVTVIAVDPTPFIGGRNQLVNRTVQADANGAFGIAVPRPLILNSGIRYEVEAIATKDGQSATTSLTLQQQ